LYPESLLYHQTHEWVKVEGGIATIGITHYAQDQMGDLVYVEVPEIGQQVNAGQPMGTVESVKAVEDVRAPVSGTIVEANHSLADAPETVNRDPYGEGWMAKVEVRNPQELAALMSAQAYQEYVASL
jgi:glycine cleavage system H protein